MGEYHISVLLKEAIDYLHVRAGKRYIDGTLGGGGHTGEILAAGGKVLGLDVDKDALAYVKEKINDKRLAIKEDDFRLARGNFKDIEVLAKANGFDKVAGILLDLGVSSHQFDTAERGFSIQASGPLDMRMDQTLAVSAKDLLNALTKDELTELFTKLGEERFAGKIAKEIVESRKKKPLETTAELESLIKRTVPRSGIFDKSGMRQIHPATKVFQALRIAVNDELNSLQDVLPKAVALLEPEGRLAVITFHSLEDRIVKHSFIAFEKKGQGMILTKKPVIPSEEEVLANPRSRSAKLRVFEKK
jgi:16S rRNA (cytosine1402-N4)-methyltransferase